MMSTAAALRPAHNMGVLLAAVADARARGADDVVKIGRNGRLQPGKFRRQSVCLIDPVLMSAPMRTRHKTRNRRYVTRSAGSSLSSMTRSQSATASACRPSDVRRFALEPCRLSCIIAERGICGLHAGASPLTGASPRSKRANANSVWPRRAARFPQLLRTEPSDASATIRSCRAGPPPAAWPLQNTLLPA